MLKVRTAARPASGVRHRAESRAESIDLSVVVPTRNESGSIGPLLTALVPALRELQAEVVFVDDSSDETPSVVAAEAGRSRVPIQLHHRPVGEREGGLGGAVKRGFEVAQGRFVTVMDADLQHPPSLVPRLLETAQAQGADVVVASRFTDGGSAGAFGRIRRLLSRSSSSLARLFFPRRLSGVTDPMSGFFLVRRERLPLVELRPNGFKILLELLVRAWPLRVAEVPYTFGERVAGESKASLREGSRYLVHLLRLRLAGKAVRFLQFAVVGASGLLVNTVLLAALTRYAALYYLASAIIATEVSIAWNYVLCEVWVFRARGRRGWIARLVAFGALNNAALAGSVPLLWLLVEHGHVHYLTANLLSIVALMLVRFAVSELVIWRRRYEPREALAPSLGPAG